MAKRKQIKARRLTPRNLVHVLCEMEQGKRQIDIAQMTEAVGRLAEIVAVLSWPQCMRLLLLLQKLGSKRLTNKQI